MNDIRSEIREEFAREQAEFPPPIDLRPRFVAEAAAQPRTRLNLQWVAAVAAILIAALIVGALVSSRIGLRGSTPAATPTTTRDYGPPPAGVPLFYLADPNHPGWYLGFDWTGRPRGTIKTGSPPETTLLLQSADGSAFAVVPGGGKGGYEGTRFLDRLGRPVPNQDPAPQYQDQMWADQGDELCVLDSTRPMWRVGVKSPGGVPQEHTIAIDSPNLHSGIIAIRLAACSPRNDRAVLVYSYFERPTEVWVVRLSSGTVLLHKLYVANQVADLIASRDGSLIAENSNKSTGYVAGPSAPRTVIRRTSDGSVVATMDPTIGVVAFSADGAFALATTSPWASGVATKMAVLEIASGEGRAVWTFDDAGSELAGFFVEPSGAGFAVMAKSTGDQTLHPFVSVIMVLAYGRSSGLPGRFVHP